MEKTLSPQGLWEFRTCQSPTRWYSQSWERTEVMRTKNIFVKWKNYSTYSKLTFTAALYKNVISFNFIWIWLLRNLMVNSGDHSFHLHICERASGIWWRMITAHCSNCTWSLLHVDLDLSKYRESGVPRSPQRMAPSGLAMAWCIGFLGNTVHHLLFSLADDSHFFLLPLPKNTILLFFYPLEWFLKGVHVFIKPNPT